MSNSVACLFALILLLAGCASDLLAPAPQDAAAKTFAQPADKAVIYLFRNESYSAPWRIGLSLDGKAAGETAADTYLRWEVESGRHLIVSHTENEAVLTLDAVAGNTYFVWQDIGMGWFRPTSRLELVDTQTGHLAIASSYRAQSPL